jgi:hypothetical protein
MHGKRTEPLGPVDDQVLERTLPLLRPRIRAMAQLHRLRQTDPVAASFEQGESADHA